MTTARKQLLDGLRNALEKCKVPAQHLTSYTRITGGAIRGNMKCTGDRLGEAGESKAGKLPGIV